MRFFVAAALIFVSASASFAQPDCDPGSRQFVLDFGNSWGHGTQNPDVGSSLEIVGRIKTTPQNPGRPMNYDNSSGSEYTFYITGVDLDAFVDSDPDTFSYGGGGTITVYYDTIKDSPGPPTANPPNASVPSLFTDGSPILIGTIDDLLIDYGDASGMGPDSTGEIRGTVTFVYGDSLSVLISPSWVWNATVNSNFFFSVPAGYNWEWSGELTNECGPPNNPVETSTWGGVKGLYR